MSLNDNKQILTEFHHLIEDNVPIFACTSNVKHKEYYVCGNITVKNISIHSWDNTHKSMDNWFI